MLQSGLVTFLAAVSKYWARSGLRDEEIVWAHSWAVEPIVVGKRQQQWQELGAVCHISSGVRKPGGRGRLVLSWLSLVWIFVFQSGDLNLWREMAHIYDDSSCQS